MAQVLIVDDSYVARKALEKILTDLGHTVVAQAADGKQAFAEYARYQPDIVTMDMTMPGMSGTEAAAKILAAYPAARIIVISASEERTVVLDALQQGARHYIIKPITAEKVAAVVENVLQQNFDQNKYRELIRKLRDVEDPTAEITRSLAQAEDRPARVLIVDDSAVARDCLKEIVASLGHTFVAEATNGAQAFVEYTRHKPDIVTMDLTMQGMSGAEATSKIIATFPEARIVVISAMEERRVVIDALERGARHFIIKPISRDKVAAVIDNVLRQHFDPGKHQELVRRLKSAEEDSPHDGLRPYQPPYRIAPEDGLVMVTLAATLTATSCRTLAIEIGEYLVGSPRVLIDFGTMTRLDETILAAIEKLIQDIEQKGGMVKALSRNPAFVDYVQELNMPTLAAMLQYFPG